MESRSYRYTQREARKHKSNGCHASVRMKKPKSEYLETKTETEDMQHMSSENNVGSLSVSNTVSPKQKLKTKVTESESLQTALKLVRKKEKRISTKKKPQSKKQSATNRITNIDEKPLKKEVKKSRSKKDEQMTEVKKEVQKTTRRTEDVKKEGHVVKTGRKCLHCPMFVGAHVSAQGGVHKSVMEAVQIGASSFGLFLRNQRQWNSKPLQEDVAVKFRAACMEHGFPPSMILPHASYLMNLGSPDPDKLQKSRDLLVDELCRCETLGLMLYNFHPGSTCGAISVEKCLHTIAESINIGHSQTKYVITVLENMSCQGNTIGGTFEELSGIIEQVKDKSRVGVCLDTCHAFAAGFDLATEEGFKNFVKSFDDIVGSQYLKAMHINDSVGIRGSHRDLHENIGKGKIGLKGFSYVMNESMFKNIPMILETPGGVGYENEIQLLHSLCKPRELTTDEMLIV
ncbi:probable endonuclease 4 [Gigantopelta aegis]|uniref:probable endonuclease 4 n=1 Tax=Gigantopelta aegis TaxID=1735272 RepID=UPI001B88ABC8|nr:probable endonuclease 4 [Gigantopelta aegis]